MSNKRKRVQIRKKEGKLNGVGQHFTISLRDIRKAINYYAQERKYVKPRKEMRPHRFDIGNITVPRTVLIDKHIPFGVGTPIYPWLRQISD